MTAIYRTDVAVYIYIYIPYLYFWWKKKILGVDFLIVKSIIMYNLATRRATGVEAYYYKIASSTIDL